MDVWEDAFSEGSRFRRVYWLAPTLSVAAMSVLLGAPWGEIGLVLLSFAFGLGLMGLNYIVAEKPALFGWFDAFRFGRRLGLSRVAAGVLAAPCMALASSIPALVMLLLFFAWPILDAWPVGFSVSDLIDIAGFLVAVSMLVSSVVAIWGGLK